MEFMKDPKTGLPYRAMTLRDMVKNGYDVQLDPAEARGLRSAAPKLTRAMDLGPAPARTGPTGPVQAYDFGPAPSTRAPYQGPMDLGPAPPRPGADPTLTRARVLSGLEMADPVDTAASARQDPKYRNLSSYRGDYERVVPLNQNPADVASQAQPGARGVPPPQPEFNAPPRQPSGGLGDIPVPPQPPPADADPWATNPKQPGGGGLRGWAGALGTLGGWDLASQISPRVKLPEGNVFKGEFAPWDQQLVPGISNRMLGWTMNAMRPMMNMSDEHRRVKTPEKRAAMNAALDKVTGSPLGDFIYGYAKDPIDKAVTATKNAGATFAKRIMYNSDRAEKQQAEQTLREQESAALLGENNNRSLRAAVATPSPSGIQTETVTYDENGNLKVVPGGDAGQPGVLSYYAPSDAKFSQTGNNARVSFGQGNNYVEFDATKAPAGAVDRIKDTIANNPEFYRQGKKYVNDRGDAMPFTNDMDARMYAAQGGGNNFAADPQATLQARLASYRAASDLINQTRAEARGLDPRLAGVIDKYGKGTLRAASAALKQQDADPTALNKQIMLKRAALRQAAAGKADKPTDAYGENFKWFKDYYPEEVAKAMARHAAASGFVFRNQAEAAAYGEQYSRNSRMLPPEAAPNANPMKLRPLSVDIPSKWRFWADPSAQIVTEGGQVATVPMNKEDALILERQLKQRQ